MNARYNCRLTPSLVTLALLAGCITPPENDTLNAARKVYAQAANDPQVMDYAPLALRDAEDSLHNTERLVTADAEQAEIAHQAYLTRQRIAIARELAEQGAAEEEIRLAESERQQILLEARTAEARQASAEAREAIRQAQEQRRIAEEQARAAQMARIEAERARERAQEMAAKANELAAQVSDLRAQETERGLVMTLGDLTFESGQAGLSEGGGRAVGKLAEFLRAYPERNILIEGYTDSVGEATFNQNLSERRAAAVQAALLADGVSADRMRTIGYGEQFPVAGNETASGRQQNRRVEVIISDKAGKIPNRS